MAAATQPVEARSDVDRSAANDGGSPRAWYEVILICGLIFLFFGSPPPDVNEAHYLTKARHYWDATWCGRDLFLDSADAHVVFYWLFGWMTRWGSLSGVAWVGRAITWFLFAVGWQRLSWVVVPRRHASVATAALFLVLADRCHLAGEWAVGGVEAKGLAYALVLFGLRALVLQRWNMVWIWMGAATALHVLVGGWSLLAAGICWWFSLTKAQHASGNLSQRGGRPPLRAMWRGLAVGLCLALVGLVPVVKLMLTADPAIARDASEIYVFARLSHHLVFHRIALVRIFSFAALLIAWGGLWWFLRDALVWRRLNCFAVATLLFSAIGVALDLGGRSHPALVAGLLKFYWFRLADVALPLVVSLGVVAAALRPFPAPTLNRQLWWSAALVLAGLLIGWKNLCLQLDFRPGAISQSQPCRLSEARQAQVRYRAWRDVCAWIAAETDPESRFLTPRGQQTFKWYAGRAELVCWKDIPQDADSIVTWWHLLQEIYTPEVIEGGLGTWSDQQLIDIAARYQVDYILIDRGRTRRTLALPKVFPKASFGRSDYELYRVYRPTAPE